MIGLYLHIPFCASKCSYCDFYSGAMTPELAQDYLNALKRAIQNTPVRDKQIDTIYFGGGTPSLLKESALQELLETVATNFSILPNCEITLEANPESSTEKKLLAWKQMGFNRVSFGVQSSVEQELQALQRLHNPQQARQSIIWASQAGFSHISADLMLGIPHQTPNSLIESLKFLTALPLDHISAYLLKLEPNTPLAESSLRNFCPCEDSVADYYLECVSFLETVGFSQYEISNFAKPNGCSQHNLKYWRDEEYLGIGPSAHSFINGNRFFFPSHLESFVKEENPFTLIQMDGKGGDWEEYAMLRLRLTEGLQRQQVAEKFPAADWLSLEKRAEPLIKSGFVTKEDDKISLTPNGFLRSNSIISHLLLF